MDETKATVSWQTVAAAGIGALGIGAAVGISMLVKADLVDLDTFTGVLGILGLGGGAFIAGKSRSS